MSTPADGGTLLAGVRWSIRRGLAQVNDRQRRDGIPQIDVAGRLIRPILSWAGVGGAAGLSDGPDSEASSPDGRVDRVPASAFWSAAGAVQMAHAASLIHDDILDDAPERRGRLTLATRDGVKSALVRGDHLLTGAYRLATTAGSLEFMALFAHSVERTVAGEVAQARAVGRTLDIAEYEEIVGGKSGALLGCALAAGPTLRGGAGSERCFALGRRIGIAYQMLDDLLDYVPGSSTGKPAWQDYRHRHWTWPLIELGPWDFDSPVADVARAMFEPAPAGAAIQRCLRTLEGRITDLAREARREVRGDIIPALLDDWLALARTAVGRALDEGGPPGTTSARMGVSTNHARDSVAQPTGAPAIAGSPATSARVDPASGGSDPFRIGERLARRLASERWTQAMDRYARSFSFAARLFPAEQRRRVADVYAVCRLTDEIADDSGPAAVAQLELDDWLRVCRAARDGTATGVSFADRAMRDARRNDVPFEYLEELVEGMRMDLRGESYDTMADLERYTYRVASVVGLWLTRLFGVTDEAVLEDAAALGRAMQLTNILRDVGEDARRERIYLPRDLLRRHGLADSDVFAMAAGTALHPAWSAAMEELAAIAEHDYRRAFMAMPELPAFYARPVAVAAAVYRGIHDSLRANGFDNFRHRAYTSSGRKVWLAIQGLRQLRVVRRQRHRLAETSTDPQTAPLKPTPDRRHAARGAVRHIAGAGIALALLGTPPVTGAQDVTMTADRAQQPRNASRDLAGRLADVEQRLAAAPHDLDLAFERLGTLWLMGVDQERAVDAALRALDSIEARVAASEDAPADTPWLVRATAYRGAFRALQGKHAFWPHSKLNHVLEGLALMDDAVEAGPTDPHARYLRLMTGFHMPGLFGRGHAVRSDLEVLAAMLPDARDEFPAEIYAEIVRFVLDNGDLSAEARVPLETALGAP